MPTVYGLFERLDLAEAGVRRLQEAGCTADMLGIALKAPGSFDASAEPAAAEPAGVMTLARAGQVVNVRGTSAYLVSGPLADGLSTASMGGIFAALLSLGHSEDDADALAQGLESGGVLVAVSGVNKSQATTSRRILDEEGARRLATV